MLYEHGAIAMPELCDRCNSPLIEIDHYGERCGSDRLFMELPEEDLEALKGTITNGRQRVQLDDWTWEARQPA
jgi:hypothetical protein